MERNDYCVVKTVYGEPLIGDFASGVKEFKFVEGKSAGDYETRTAPRSIATYRSEVIDPLAAAGKLGLEEIRDADGKITQYCDLKLRNGGMRVGEGGILTMAAGLSHFGACLGDRKRSDEQNYKMQEQAMKDHGNRWAYHQHNPGVAGIIVAKEGISRVGKRTNDDGEGALNSVAGHVTANLDFSKIDVLKDLYTEAAEEMGVKKENIVSLRFVGAFGNDAKSDFDNTWIVQTNLPNSYFADDGQWKENRTSEEHENLIELATMGQVRQLLETGTIEGHDKQFEVMYSTRGGLKSLTEADLKGLR